MFSSRLVVFCVLVPLLCCSVACTGDVLGGPSGPSAGQSSGVDTETNHARGDDPADNGDAPADAPPGDPGTNDTSDIDAGTTPPSSVDAGTTTPGSTLAGLPCDVSNLLSQHCVSCHTQPPVGGAHVSLLSIDDLHAASPTTGAGDVAHDALARMQSTGPDHMPLGGTNPTSSEIAAFESWVTSGTPAGDCGSLLDDAGTPPAPDPTFSGTTICTSNQHWTSGNQGSSRMHPGVACIDCHSRSEGPGFSLAGTLFPTGHEPDDCLGVNDQTVRVEVTDANGQVINLTVNGSGNFYSSKSVSFPITAKVLSNGSERVMATPVNSGDCNSCHTVDGSQGAPGRIALP